MHRVVDLSEAEWDRNMAINAEGVFLATQAAVRYWLADSIQGVIVNTASLAFGKDVALLAHYAASKFMIVGFTQSLAREVAGAASGQLRLSGVRAHRHAGARGGVGGRAARHDARRGAGGVRGAHAARPPRGRDVADTVLFLASDAARFITGEALNVTGGVRMD